MSNNLYNNDYTTLNNLYNITVSGIDLNGNINQEVGNKSNLDEINCNSLNIVDTINTIPTSNLIYLNNLTSNIQEQLDLKAKLNVSNSFTGPLNIFDSIFVIILIVHQLIILLVLGQIYKIK